VPSVNGWAWPPPRPPSFWPVHEQGGIWRPERGGGHRADQPPVLIPVFFVSLGLLVDARMLLTVTGLLALGAALLLIGVREILHRRWLKTGGDRHAFLLLCPNLTLAALAAKALLTADNRAAATWVVLCGLCTSVISLCLLPACRKRPAILGRHWIESRPDRLTRPTHPAISHAGSFHRSSGQAGRGRRD